MHSYATDSVERRNVPLLLGIVAIVLTWGISQLVGRSTEPMPWWLSAPSVMGLYGGIYVLFNKYLWSWSLLGRLRLIKVPDLSGEWTGYVTSSFDEHAEQHDVSVTIKQTWRGISVFLRAEHSESHSVIAALYTEAPGGPVLTYQYQNTPGPNAVSTMEIHYGTAEIALTAGGKLEGSYYSGRGRKNVGALVLKRSSS